MSPIRPPADPFADAPCRRLPPDVADELLFPERREGRTRAHIERVREVCSRCPVQDDCLDLALRVEGTLNSTYRHGWYGGFSPAERAALAG